MNINSVRDSLARVPAPALLAAAVVIVGLIIFAVVFSGDATDGSSETVLDPAYTPVVEGVAAEVSQAFSPYQEAALAIAADARVIAAMAQAQSDKLDQLVADVSPDLPHLQKLRLLPVTTDQPRNNEMPPLTFTSIALLKEIAAGKKSPPLEAVLIGTDDEHLVLMASVSESQGEDNESVVGAVHLSIDPDLVRDVISAGAPADAFIQIRQGIKVDIASAGTKPAADAARKIVRINGSRLVAVIAAPGKVVAPDDGSGGLMTSWLVPAAGVTLLLLLGGLIMARRKPRSDKLSGGDAVVYQGAIRAILDGAHPGLEQLLPGGANARTNFDLASLDDGIEGDDITTFGNSADTTATEDPTTPHPDAEPNAELSTEAPMIDVSTIEAVPASIFRSYDIRGIVDETLTEDGVYQIGRALGAEADARGQKTIVVARDGRHSSAPLREALCKGLLESGRDVLDIGVAPTPVLYFATHHLDAKSGVMITGSHNPAQYNGLKIVLDGQTLSGEAIQAIRQRVETQDFIDGTGSLQQADIGAEYIRRISEEIPVTLGNALKVVVDCGNGVPGAIAPDLLRAIGHDVIELYCDVDGDFPNHHPDPSQPENLEDLINTVAAENADLGLAFDGDGDRLGVVDATGAVLWPDRQMMLFARDILSRNPGAKIIYDVKCSRLLAQEISAAGGEAIMAKTGHSLIKAKMQETGALLAGEMSGHIFFKERWYGFDDALYSAARLLEILVNAGQTPAEVFAALPDGVTTPELRIDLSEEQHAPFMAKILEKADFSDGELTTIDGLRVDFADSWGLIRPSNTTPCLVLRFEGDNEAALENVKTRFRELISAIDSSLNIPF